MTKVEHNEIGKHPEVIKKAQEDLLKMDVLVCGGCHSTYHFVEEFSEHKRKCTSVQPEPHEKPDLKTNWAFLLWKSSQPNHSTQSVWKLYQTWAALDEKQRNAWTTAGQSIQSISRLAQGAVQETVVKVMRTITDGAKTTPTAVNSAVTANRTAIAARRAADLQGKKDDDETNTDEDYGSPKAGTVLINRKASLSPVKTGRRYLVKRTMSNSAGADIKECFAERVMSRRMNVARNYYEYNVKWSDYPNTWEPRSHFEKAPEIVADFERLLPKGKPPIATIPAASRPIRNSKVRAVDQVKQWCSPDEGASAAAAELKRKNADSDYAEAEDSSQDEAAGSSPSPRKQIKTTPTVVQRTVGGSGPLRYYPKSVNGAVTPTNSGEVVVTTSAHKATGVVRKPGVTTTSPTKKEAQIKVVGKNEVTNSGIVRVGAAGTTPTASGGQRMQRVLQTVRTPGQAPITRTVLRPVPATTTTSSPVAKLGVVRQSIATTTPVRPNQYVVKRGINPGLPGTAAKISPGALPRGIVRSPAAQTATTTGPTTRVVRKVVGKSEASAADSETSLTLCPVTGKLISSKEESNADLQRLLTNEGEEDQATENATQEAEGQAVAEDGQIQQLISNEDGSPVLVTGEDGTIYQVAGKNADGQTLLIAQGTGEQACVYLASEDGGEATTTSTDTATEGQVTTENADATAVVVEAETAVQSSSEGTGEDSQTQSMLVDQDSQDGQITAELVQADEPSADGTRRVVLLLPDGNLMVTEVNEEQYQQFNLGS